MSKHKPHHNQDSLSGLATRDGFAAGLMSLAKTDKKVVALSADLTKSVGMQDFEQEFPERFFQLGIAEQNMAGVACGLALEGKTVFMGSFASFQPYRNLDQIRSSICTMNANVKIVSSHAGFSYPPDGIQVQALEDIAIMRSLPNMLVLVPADAQQAAELTEQSAVINGPVYIRVGRAPVGDLSSMTKELPATRIGKAQVIKEGKDAVIIACGYMVEQAYQAISALRGLNIGLVNMHTIKPLDTKAVLHLAERYGKIITVEEHQTAGGLGSAVAEVLAQSNLDVRLKILAVSDRFGDTGETPAQMYDAYGISAKHIESAVVEILN